MTVHDEVLQVLSARLDGEADPAQRALAERHLEQCAACAATDEAFRRVDALARAALLPAGPPPSAATPFTLAVAERLAAEPTGGQPARSRHPRSRLWPAWVAAMLGVLALVLAAIVVPSVNRAPLPGTTGVPGSAARPNDQPPPEPLTLARVMIRAEQAAAEVRTLTGRFTRTWSGIREASPGTTVTNSYRFVFASPDRLRVEGDRRAYRRLQINDGPAARQVMVWRDNPRPSVRTGMPLVRPQGEDALAPLTEGLTLWSRGELEGPDRPARLTERDGRRVYVLLLRYEWSLVAGPARITHLEVWLDPDTFLPARIQYQDRSRPGRPIRRGDVRYTYERVNGPVPAGSFAVPDGAKVTQDDGFRSMSLERAKARASYKVPEIRALPRPGWRLLRAGYAPVGSQTGTEGLNPPGKDLVVAVYGAGLERLVMTTLSVRDEELWHGRYNDPFGGEGIVRAVEDHRLRAGAFAGTVAHIGKPSDDAPYLWLRSGKLVVTLSGASTSRQLIAAAESLHF
jgi:Putative zinc-finger